MKVKFQYTDWTEWEGHPKDAVQSPDKGVVRMYAITDTGRQVIFVYDDFYYLYPGKNGKWHFGSGIPKRTHVLTPGKDGSEAEMMEVDLPKGAIVRTGETISHKEAMKFGLVKRSGKMLHVKAPIIIRIGK